MTLVVEAQGITHDVQEHHLTDGGDAMYVRTHCGHYIKESVFTLEPKPGVPTCMSCVVGRLQWERAVRTFLDAAGGTREDAEKMLDSFNRGFDEVSSILNGPLVR